MDKIILLSPAKINIGLNVIRKRDDGYHDLETIFYPLLLSDILSFEKADRTNLASNSNEILGLETNLILSSQQLLENRVNQKLNVNINLEKNIPLGAGLGGGSSNAATTLKALNKIYNLNLSYKELSAIGLNLGSDVPFFLDPVPCFAYSRGELKKNIHLSLSHPILVVNPGVHISTQWAFEHITLKNPNNSLENLSEQPVISIDEIRKFITNDFEEIVFNNYPEIRKIKEALYSLGAKFALMTGTGSSVYGIFSNLQTAMRAKEEFERKYFTYLNFPVNQGSIT
jgi:4-diphosphocytidyl-2-C-methyl-D-erythritol kinase